MVIDAGVDNSEGLVALRSFLSSREVLLVFDNAESISDPQGMDGQEIYGVVEELSQLDNVCLCIASRISTFPSNCETFDIPTLSVGVAIVYARMVNGSISLTTSIVSLTLDHVARHRGVSKQVGYDPTDEGVGETTGERAADPA